eukprot:m.340608 g.340608  ORF g.340608 m.340608 type:complete len:301 (-) comp19407_c0_seq1:101-1003(-)
MFSSAVRPSIRRIITQGIVKPSKCFRALSSLPLNALEKANTLTEYKELRGLPRHMPLSYFPELSDFGPTFKDKLRALQAAEESASTPIAGNIAVSICVERYPRLIPDKTAEEKDWEEFNLEMHVEKSAIFQYEAEFLQEEAEKARRKAQGEVETRGNILTFEPADRISDADRANDKRSLFRKQTEKLYLVGKAETPFHASLGPWHFPIVKVGDNETLREASERAVKDILPSETEVYIISNSPSYCETIGDEGNGVKVFYYRAALVSLETLPINTAYTDYQWLSKSETEEECPTLRDTFLI